MATHTGSEGVVKVGNIRVAEVRSYSIEQTGDTVEDTTMGDTARTFKPTLTSWTASVDVYWDETDSAQAALLVPNAQVVLGVYPEGDASGDTFYSGNAIVTGVSISGSFDGMVEASLSLQGTGALTETN